MLRYLWRCRKFGLCKIEEMVAVVPSIAALMGSNVSSVFAKIICEAELPNLVPADAESDGALWCNLIP